MVCTSQYAEGDLHKVGAGLREVRSLVSAECRAWCPHSAEHVLRTMRSYVAKIALVGLPAKCGAWYRKVRSIVSQSVEDGLHRVWRLLRNVQK